MDAYDSEREQQPHGHQDRPGHQDHPDHRDRGERAALGWDAHGEHGQGQGHEHGHSAQAHGAEVPAHVGFTLELLPPDVLPPDGEGGGER
ncbi:hypothetical protein [Streptomyces bacillaris]|uniref:hypothetical protein n=1 Tax=Streptomyces bacillaris TaxID=68179 RepID=UPI003653515B